MSPAPIRILLVENSPSYAKVLQESLIKAGPGQFDFTRVETLADGLSKLRQPRFDVVLLDLSLPDSHGRETFLRARFAAPWLPIVVLSDSADEAIGIKSLQQGIQDYLVKGQTNGRQLARAIRHAIELQRAEERNRLQAHILDAIGKVVIATDLNQSITYWNHAAASLFGWPCEAVLGQNLASLTGPQTTPEQNAEILATLRRGETWTGEITCRGKDGSPVSLLTTNSTFLRDVGQPAGIFSIGVDLTERRRVEAQLRTMQDELEQLVMQRTADLEETVHELERQVASRKQTVQALEREAASRQRTERNVEGVRGLLELFATKTSRKEYVDAVVRFLRDWCQCRCVGIRLSDQQGGMPYVASVGYSREFLKRETCLHSVSDNCPCFRILQGQPTQDDVQFTGNKGSFFCHSIQQYADCLWTTPAARARAICLQAGYNSLAHSPIHYHGRLFGSIHLADQRKNRFPAETVVFIESIAPLVGEAIHRFQVEESLQESEQRFRSMFESHAAVMLLVEPNSGAIQDANSAAAAFYGYTRQRLQTMNINHLNTMPLQFVTAQRKRALRGDQGCFVFPHRLASGEVRTVEVHSTPIRVQGRLLLFSIIHDITDRKLLEKQILDFSQQERQRLGQDLHDSLGGTLTGVALISKALAQKLSAKSMQEAGLAGEVALAEEIVRCVNESISQTRVIARGLCPIELTAAGLVNGLRDFAAEIERQFHISCRFQSDKGILIQNSSVATHLFRIVQEAVHNAIRHGEAHAIGIRLTKAKTQIVLEIRDDGVGLPAPLPATKGMGLRTMKYRADTIGAEFSVKRRRGKGTAVSCLLPIQSADNTRT